MRERYGRIRLNVCVVPRVLDKLAGGVFLGRRDAPTALQYVKGSEVSQARAPGLTPKQHLGDRA